MSIYVKNEDIYSEAVNVNIRDNDTWHSVKNVWLKSNDVWSIIFSRPVWSLVSQPAEFRDSITKLSYISSVCYNNNINSFFAITTNGLIGKSNEGYNFTYYSTLPRLVNPQILDTYLKVQNVSNLIYNNGVMLVAVYYTDIDETYTQVVLFESTSGLVWRHVKLLTGKPYDSNIQINIAASSSGRCVVVTSSGEMVSFNILGDRVYNLPVVWVPLPDRDRNIPLLTILEDIFILWAHSSLDVYEYSYDGLGWWAGSTSPYSIQSAVYIYNNRITTTASLNNEKYTLTKTTITNSVSTWSTEPGILPSRVDGSGTVINTSNLMLTAFVDVSSNSFNIYTVSADVSANEYFNTYALSTVLTNALTLNEHSVQLTIAGDCIFAWVGIGESAPAYRYEAFVTTSY